MYHCHLHTISNNLGDFIILEYNHFITALCPPEELLSVQKKMQNYLQNHVEFDSESNTLLQQAEQQINAYFSGQLRQFDLPIKLYGTDFQKSVWEQLLQIPYGQTTTYGAIGRKLNQKGARAVGSAVGKNPLPIIVPCHRVLPKSGEIGNFSFIGGSASKAYLLDLEGAYYRK